MLILLARSTEKHIALLCQVDLYSGTEERATDWQKVFITQTARRQQWKDQGLLQQDTAVPREPDPGQQTLARNSSHAIAVFCCGWLPKSQLKTVKCFAPPHVKIFQYKKSRREGCKNNWKLDFICGFKHLLSLWKEIHRELDKHHFFASLRFGQNVGRRWED